MFQTENIKNIVISVIKAIDIINPILKNHHRRVAIISYQLGCALKLDDESLANLVIAAALHDVGALTVKDEAELKKLDVESPEEHQRLGAIIFDNNNNFSKIKNIIMNHHIKYYKYLELNKLDNAIPLECLILHLADRIEVLLNQDSSSLDQKDHVLKTILSITEDIFSQDLIALLVQLSDKEFFWYEIDNITFENLLDRIDMKLICPKNDLKSIEETVSTLSKIIDYKCNYTAFHSVGVAQTAYSLALFYGLPEPHAFKIKIAGYLHDIGKIGVPSELLNKNGPLTSEEFNIIKIHPYYTKQILQGIEGFEDITNWAASHHENLKRSGYPEKPEQAFFSVEVIIIAYADVFTALCENRPYRQHLDLDSAIETIALKFKDLLGQTIYDVLILHSEFLYQQLLEIQIVSRNEDTHKTE